MTDLDVLQLENQRIAQMTNDIETMRFPSGDDLLDIIHAQNDLISDIIETMDDLKGGNNGCTCSNR